MVRDTAGSAGGVGETLPFVVGKACAVVVFDDEVVCVCADTNAAAAKTKMARDGFFTSILDLGEKESFLILLYGAGLQHQFKETGRDGTLVTSRGVFQYAQTAGAKRGRRELLFATYWFVRFPLRK